MFVKILLYDYFLFWVDLLSFLLKATAVSTDKDAQRRDLSVWGGASFFEGTEFERPLKTIRTYPTVSYTPR